MRRLGLTLILAAAAVPPVGRTQVAPPPEAADEVEGVTVTARRPAPTVARPGPADPDPFSFFQDHCFDAMRLSRRSARPAGDPRWTPLSAEARAQLGVTDRSTVAYARLDPERGLALLLRIEQGPMASEVRDDLIQHRCSLTVKGPADARDFKRSMSALFNGSPTARHVDNLKAPGYASMPGWDQWLWSAIPSRGSSKWEVFGNGAMIVVHKPRFYDGCDYVAGELRHTEDRAEPVSILLLTHTFTRASSAARLNARTPCR